MERDGHFPAVAFVIVMTFYFLDPIECAFDLRSWEVVVAGVDPASM